MWQDGVLYESDFAPCLLLPLSNLLSDLVYHVLGCAILPKSLHEFAIWIHEVDVYRMIYEVVTLGVCVGWSGEIHPICFTDRFGGGVFACKPDDPGVEVSEILFHLASAVTSRVDRDKDWLENLSIFRFYDQHCEHARCIARIG